MRARRTREQSFVLENNSVTQTAAEDGIHQQWKCHSTDRDVILSSAPEAAAASARMSQHREEIRATLGMGDRQRCEGGRKRIKERNVWSKTRRTSTNCKLEKGSSQERDARERGFNGELEGD